MCSEMGKQNVKAKKVYLLPLFFLKTCHKRYRWSYSSTLKHYSLIALIHFNIINLIICNKTANHSSDAYNF